MILRCSKFLHIPAITESAVKSPSAVVFMVVRPLGVTSVYFCDCCLGNGDLRNMFAQFRAGNICEIYSLYPKDSLGASFFVKSLFQVN